MILLLIVIAAFPIGYFVRRRPYALVSFLCAALFLFNVQTLNLLTSWLSGDSTAFGPPPDAFPIEADSGEVIAYGVVNLVLVLGGLGLVVLGSSVAARRAAKRNVISVNDLLGRDGP